jgi:hypothetical protein
VLPSYVSYDVWSPLFCSFLNFYLTFGLSLIYLQYCDDWEVAHICQAEALLINNDGIVCDSPLLHHHHIIIIIIKKITSGVRKLGIPIKFSYVSSMFLDERRGYFEIVSSIYFPKIHLKFILRCSSRSSKWPFSTMSRRKNPVCIPCPPPNLGTCSVDRGLLDFPSLTVVLDR